MKKRWMICLALVLALLGLSACSKGQPQTEQDSSVDPPQTEQTAQTPDVHTHTTGTDDNVVIHDPAGYCGNTLTTITYSPAEGDGWSRTFSGSASVNLTDLLRYLDYREENLCKCMPEYTVDTEFGQGYGLSVTQDGGYARYQGAQANLTPEQAATVLEILEQAEQAEDGDVLSDSGLILDNGTPLWDPSEEHWRETKPAE